MYLMISTAINIFLASISYGFVLTKLWVWFIIPIFHIPALTIVPAMGIILTVSLLRPVFPALTIEITEDKKTNRKVMFSYAILSLIHPWIALLVGWILKFFL